MENILQGRSGILSASSWKKIIRRATSSIPSERYQSVDEFVAAIRHRNRGRHIAICLLVLALLAGGREYWVSGPGVLDGMFCAEGTNVTMRLRDCIVRNRASEPLGKVGISYDLQDGAGLDLPELDEPDDHGRHYIERSGSPTRLMFKGTGLCHNAAGL